MGLYERAITVVRSDWCLPVAENGKGPVSRAFFLPKLGRCRGVADSDHQNVTRKPSCTARGACCAGPICALFVPVLLKFLFFTGDALIS
jgi:hypothetical protein